VKTLALSAVAAAAILSSGFAANAQDWDHQRSYAPPAPILGEGGAHFANQCWVETWGGGSSYFGYWKDCGPASRVSKR
jgi:hypothetical protein